MSKDVKEMRLSVESAEVCEKFGDIEGLSLIKNAGFDAVDFSYCGLSDDSPVLGKGYREYAHKLRNHIDKLGLVCNQAHAPFNLSRTEKFDMSEPHYNEIVHSIEAAAILGAEHIIVHPIYVPVGETVNGISYEDYNHMYYKSLEPYCREFGIKIAVENMFYVDTKRKYRRGMLHTPETLTAIVKRLDSPYFVACVDIGHLAITGEEEPEKFIRCMEPSVLKALHVHDNDYIMDMHILPFTGDINWKEVMPALKEMGYTGDLTYEICTYLKKFPNELIPDALKLAQSVGRYLISLFENA